MKITAYFDGACSPENPGGTATFGAIVFFNKKKKWDKSGLYTPKVTGQTSNNLAEYAAILCLLNYLAEEQLNKESITIYGDSKLVVNQIMGMWKIKNGTYVPLALEAKKLFTSFPNTTVKWIPREQNEVADELSKRELIKLGIETEYVYSTCKHAFFCCAENMVECEKCHEKYYYDERSEIGIKK